MWSPLEASGVLPSVRTSLSDMLLVGGARAANTWYRDDASGVRLASGSERCLVAGFRGVSRVLLSRAEHKRDVCRVCGRWDLEVLGGRGRIRVAAASDGVVHVPDTEAVAQVTVMAAEAWAQDGPGVFSPVGLESAVEMPVALVGGTLHQPERRRNQIGGGSFWHGILDAGVMTLDVLLPDEPGLELRDKMGIRVLGWVSARLAPATEHESAAARERYTQKDPELLNRFSEKAQEITVARAAYLERQLAERLIEVVRSEELQSPHVVQLRLVEKVLETVSWGARGRATVRADHEELARSIKMAANDATGFARHLYQEIGRSVGGSLTDLVTSALEACASFGGGRSDHRGVEAMLRDL